MSTRAAELLAAIAGLVLLWLEVAALYVWAVPQDRSLGAFAGSEVAASGAAVFLLWRANESKMGQSAYAWLLAFPVGVILSLVFVEMDCAGTLHLVAGSPTCTQFHGNISLVFTASAFALMVAALPNALRAWLGRRRARPPLDRSG